MCYIYNTSLYVSEFLFWNHGSLKEVAQYVLNDERKDLSTVSSVFGGTIYPSGMKGKYDILRWKKTASMYVLQTYL